MEGTVEFVSVVANPDDLLMIQGEGFIEADIYELSKAVSEVWPGAAVISNYEYDVEIDNPIVDTLIRMDEEFTITEADSFVERVKEELKFARSLHSKSARRVQSSSTPFDKDYQNEEELFNQVMLRVTDNPQQILFVGLEGRSAVQIDALKKFIDGLQIDKCPYLLLPIAPKIHTIDTAKNVTIKRPVYRITKELDDLPFVELPPDSEAQVA